MGRLIVSNIFRFLFLILLQVLVFKNIGYYNLAAPFPYVLIILLLPTRIPNFFLYLFAFGIGITVDAFYDTLGVHAAACIVMAWVRILFINLTFQADSYENMETPSASETSFRWFLIYALVLIFFHHLTLFLLETFSFSNILYTFLSVIFSCIFTLVLVSLYEILFYKRKKR